MKKFSFTFSTVVSTRKSHLNHLSTTLSHFQSIPYHKLDRFTLIDRSISHIFIQYLAISLLKTKSTTHLLPTGRQANYLFLYFQSWPMERYGEFEIDVLKVFQ
jgi:hypothetical protein